MLNRTLGSGVRLEPSYASNEATRNGVPLAESAIAQSNRLKNQLLEMVLLAKAVVRPSASGNLDCRYLGSPGGTLLPP